MKILVWGINYAPEHTGIAPYNVLLCEYLRDQGHAMEMVTTFAYYPQWTKRPEDRGLWYRTDHLNGVPVHRCWHYVPEKVTALKRMLHEATFVTTSFFRILTLPRTDVMVVISPPLPLGTAAWLAGVLKRSPFIFHVQDLQPDAALGLGMLRAGWLARALYGLEALAYAAASRVSGITHGMLHAYARKGVPAWKRVYFPNPVRVPESLESVARGAFRQRMGFAAEDFVALYSGNLGVKQGLGILLEAATLCRAPGVRIMICGDGAERAALEQRARELDLANVRFLPLQDKARYEEMLVDADLCLITQQAGSGLFFFPSKLLTTLAFAKPVLVVADAESELALAVDEWKCGFRVTPGEAQAMADALVEAKERRSALPEMGRRGREYVRRFEAERVLGEFERVLREVGGPGESRA